MGLMHREHFFSRFTFSLPSFLLIFASHYTCIYSGLLGHCSSASVCFVLPSLTLDHLNFAHSCFTQNVLRAWRRFFSTVLVVLLLVAVVLANFSDGCMHSSRVDASCSTHTNQLLEHSLSSIIEQTKGEEAQVSKL